MTENGKLMPNLDQQTTKALNLTVLQRVDQFVEEILITAAHVTLYEFNIDLSQWSRKDVEGSLFVVKRNKQPRFQFIVMNRRNEDNLVENLLGDFEFEIQVPYLLYRNASQEVNGIWFYNPQECKEVFNLFSRILNAYAKVPAKLSVPSGKSEFEELEAVPTMASMDGPLEPSSATTSDVTDVPSNHLFASFFGTALSLGSGASGALMPPSIPPAVVPTAAPLSGPNVYNPHILDVPQNNHLSSRTANNAPLSAPNVYNPHILDVPQNGHLNNRSANNAPLSAPNVYNPHILDVPQNSHLNNRSANNAPLSAPNVCNPHILDIPQNSHLGSRTANNLVKPSSFFNPSPPVSSSSIPTAPPLDPSGNRPYGTPLLQPFPPPTPSSSLTPIPAPALNHGPGYTREEVRNVLLSLVQDDQFIDIVHRALLKTRTC